MKTAVRRGGLALVVAAAIVAAAVTLAATRWVEADSGSPAATVRKGSTRQVVVTLAAPSETR